MTGWFDKRAVQAGALTPEQTRKVKAIVNALAKSDRLIKDHLISIDTFERSAMKVRSGRVTAEWPRRVAGMQSETLAARDRLGQLHTGMRAENTLRAALAELASAFGAWHRGLSSSDADVIDDALAHMKRHYANAVRLGKSGFLDLKAGR
jgi:hypothetical protein